MSSFTAELHVMVTQRRRRGRCLAVLLTPFVYEVGALGSGERIEVPAGFETDFTSTPRWAWWLEPPLGPAGKASVLHDWLYETQARPRAEADRVFAEALAVLQVPRWKRALLWAAVRLGGWRAWLLR